MADGCGSLSEKPNTCNMRSFKFLYNNKPNIQEDPLWNLNVYENMALGLVHYCHQRGVCANGYQHQFTDMGIQRFLVIENLIFESTSDEYSSYVRVRYQIYDQYHTTTLEFRLPEEVFHEVMSRNETI